MFKDFSAPVPGQALVSDRAAARLAPSGFDPSRIYDDFAAWVGRQDATRVYDYWANCGCAFAEFLRETGVAVNPLVGGTKWCDGKGPDHHFPKRIEKALLRQPYAFGALHVRLTEAA